MLRSATPLLTIRSIRPDQLEQFIGDIRSATEGKPLADSVHCSSGWTVPDDEVFKPIIDQYQVEYNKEHTDEQEESSVSSSMEVLGLPLLAHLAIRLIAQWPGDPKELVSNPTTLYRSMVDLTCGNAGKGPGEQADLQTMHRVSGRRLRELLHRTAAAMTACGGESISYQELSYRLGKDGDQLEQETRELVSEHELSALMIAYFFKGGHKDLGCEFLHKSFREYLFAEGIVEGLKEFGRLNNGYLEPRSIYWKDFGANDPRYAFSRRLAYLLAPQWLSDEVVVHLENLLPWEIERSAKPELWQAKTPADALELESISIGQWQQTRDGLADIWDWWAEGVPLRPQPERKRGTVSFSPPLTDDLSQFSVPFDSASAKEVLPPRTATMDAHLGDGLFRLACMIHFQSAMQKGWLDAAKCQPENSPLPHLLWRNVTDIGKGPRNCQSRVTIGEQEFVLFAPGGATPHFLQNYLARVDAAAWRPSGPFPNGVNMSGLDLRGASISPRYQQRHKSRATWRFANFEGAQCILGCYFKSDFSCIFGRKVDFSGSAIGKANFSFAELPESAFQVSFARGANFTNAFLEGAFFEDANLDGATFAAAEGVPGRFKVVGDVQNVPGKWGHSKPLRGSIRSLSNSPASPDNR